MPSATQALTWLSDRIWALRLAPKRNFNMFVGTVVQVGAMNVSIEPKEAWDLLDLQTKLRAILANRWGPTHDQLLQLTQQFLVAERFGGEDDAGPGLIRFQAWLNTRPWAFPCLTPRDEQRAQALNAHAYAVHHQFHGYSSFPPLNLRLRLRCPQLYPTLFFMGAKVPLVSVRYFVEVDVRHAFNAIRAALHPRADTIVDLLYELLSLQQKTAFALAKYFKSAIASKDKGDALFTNDEIENALYGDLLIPYLKATVEKVVAFVGAIFEVEGLDNKKRHAARVSALRAAIPHVHLNTDYGELLMYLVDGTALEDINRLRTGLLHKRGVADLQPHSYVGVPAATSRRGFLLLDLLEQHAKNSAALLASIALLTDDLVVRAPPQNIEGLVRELASLQSEQEFEVREAKIAG